VTDETAGYWPGRLTETARSGEVLDLNDGVTQSDPLAGHLCSVSNRTGIRVGSGRDVASWTQESARHPGEPCWPAGTSQLVS
jgi:hypothetical protein